MWSSGPASHGHSSGNGCREQVITRHPAEAKRLTVAWPMPRLAPVSSSVLRSGIATASFAEFPTLAVGNARSRGRGPAIDRLPAARAAA